MVLGQDYFGALGHSTPDLGFLRRSCHLWLEAMVNALGTREALVESLKELARYLDGETTLGWDTLKGKHYRFKKYAPAVRAALAVVEGRPSGDREALVEQMATVMLDEYYRFGSDFKSIARAGLLVVEAQGRPSGIPVEKARGRKPPGPSPVRVNLHPTGRPSGECGHDFEGLVKRVSDQASVIERQVSHIAGLEADLREAILRAVDFQDLLSRCRRLLEKRDAT